VVLDAPGVARLSAAERAVGELAGLARWWQPWPEFARVVLGAWWALGEVEGLGLRVDAAQLLALGPQPHPSRPRRSLRWAVGLVLARRRLEAEPSDRPLTLGLVTRLYHHLDAPHLARGGRRPQPPGPVAGGAAWTLAGRWREAGLPGLWAACLALAAWEREAPEPAPRRHLAGRTLLLGLAPRLGIPAHALDRLGPALAAAAGEEGQPLEDLLSRVRRQGAWRPLFHAFLRAVERSAREVAELARAAAQRHRRHHELVDTWVRAPNNPKRLLDLLLVRPVVDLPLVARRLEVTQRTAGLLVAKLADQGLLREITGQRRGRRWAYLPLLQLLQPGWGESPAPPEEHRNEPEHFHTRSS